MQLTLIPYASSSSQLDLTTPNIACFELVYANGVVQALTAATLTAQMIDPRIVLSTVTRSACLIVATTFAKKWKKYKIYIL